MRRHATPRRGEEAEISGRGMPHHSYYGPRVGDSDGLSDEAGEFLSSIDDAVWRLSTLARAAAAGV